MGGIDTNLIPTVHSLGKVVTKDVDEKTALKSFEAYVLGDMLKRTAPDNPTGLFDGGDAGRMYQDHLYQEMARLIAEQGDFGLAKQLKGHLGGAETADLPGGEMKAETQREDSK